jgi:uridine monophosphate synthetase
MSEVSQSTIDQVAEELHKNQLIKFGKFTLKSGIESPFYIDLREVQSHPSTYRAVVKAYSEMLFDIDPSMFLAGVPEAGTPLASMVGYELDRPLVQPRKVIKDHGTKSSVEGAFQTGDKVVLIDDLITKGDSKLEAIDQVEAAGLQIEKFLVLVDREQGGIEMIREKGYDIQAAFTITSLMNTLHEQDKISGPEYDTVMNFILNN